MLSGRRLLMRGRRAFRPLEPCECVVVNLVVSGCAAALHRHCVVPTDGSRVLPSGWVALLHRFWAIPCRCVTSITLWPSGLSGAASIPRTIWTRWQRSGPMPRCLVMPLASWPPDASLKNHQVLAYRSVPLPDYLRRCAATGLLRYGFLMRAFFEVFAPAAEGRSWRPGITRACRRWPFLFSGLWLVGSRGCTSIVRLPPVVAS